MALSGRRDEEPWFKGTSEFPCVVAVLSLTPKFLVSSISSPPRLGAGYGLYPAGG